jgi:hypothetical protein
MALRGVWKKRLLFESQWLPKFQQYLTNFNSYENHGFTGLICFRFLQKHKTLKIQRLKLWADKMNRFAEAIEMERWQNIWTSVTILDAATKFIMDNQMTAISFIQI